MLKRIVLPWLGWSYALFIALWLFVRSLGFVRFWWIELLNYIAIYLFIPLPILLVTAFWLRRWRLIVGLGIPTFAFCSFYGALFLPSLPKLVAPGQDITAMTFNLRSGNQDYLPIAQVIRAENPDIIGVQEWIPELAQPLVQTLADDYPYTTLIPEQ